MDELFKQLMKNNSIVCSIGKDGIYNLYTKKNISELADLLQKHNIHYAVIYRLRNNHYYSHRVDLNGVRCCDVN